MDWTQVTWRPGVGDPTVAGWLVAGALGIAGLLSLGAVFKAYPNRRVAGFWLGTALILLLLAFNKQLDLHVLLIQVGRALVHGLGWTAWRRQIEGVFALLLGVGLLIGLVAWLWPLRKWWRYLAWGMGGLLFTLLVTFYRAIYFCHVLGMVNHNLYALLELIGPFWVIAGTLRFLTSDPIHRHF